MELTLDQAKRLMDENHGDLDLCDTDVTSLPDGLTVEGSLYLTGTRVSSLPKGLKVGRDLNLYDSDRRPRTGQAVRHLANTALSSNLHPLPLGSTKGWARSPRTPNRNTKGYIII